MSRQSTKRKCHLFIDLFLMFAERHLLTSLCHLTVSPSPWFYNSTAACLFVFVCSVPVDVCVQVLSAAAGECLCHYLDDKINKKLQNLIAFLPVYLVLITVRLALKKDTDTT